ncbi:hypothetical protein [Lachnospira pectinoschiza]|uniref:Uncharacterized protein n=1 Tax=Lachnospira pectinoschiza TaxID=28052 RepID=A0A1G9YSF0_9FIRM|nr:hypothetical protein [Lachnospira pectinoschiza]SDN12058.1 hypothetical protein SAMN05216544_1917 [Lachnospira pectinoschiza]
MSNKEDKVKLKKTLIRIGKSTLILAVAAFVCFNLVDCNFTGSSTVNSVLNEKTNETTSTNQSVNDYSNTEATTENESTVDDSNGPVSSNGIDYDLTEMSSTMVYATVYEMMAYPSLYEGKTVKMEGQYYALYVDADNTYYMYCLVSDALGCCTQGMEFVWGDGSHVYPDEYPADKTEVVVSGTFKTYTQDGNTYCCIDNATMEVAK